MSISLKNIVTLITGGSSGYGFKLLERLIKQGSLVINFDLIPLKNCNKSVLNVLGDVTSEANVREAMDKCWLNFGRLDAVVHCATTNKGYNYFATYNVNHLALPLFQENELNDFGCRGSIINSSLIQPLDEDKYQNEEKNVEGKIENLDAKVMQLANDIVKYRIRTNTVMISNKDNHEKIASLMQEILQNQMIVGQIIEIDKTNADESNIST